jgi:hypothetical protein
MLKRGIALGALLLLSTAAHAACELPGRIGPNPLQQVLIERQQQCFGEENDREPLTERILKIQACDAREPDKLLQLRQALLGAIGALETESAALGQGGSPQWQSLAAALQSEVSRTRAPVSSGDGLPPAVLWEWRNHRAVEREPNVFAVDYAPLVTASCTTTSSAPCADAMSRTVRVNRVVNLTNRVLRCAGQARLKEAGAALTKLDAAWNHYFFDTRSQFVWELAVNSWRFNASDNILAAPPADQIIFLHPGVALEYVGSDAGREDAYDAIVLAEVIGYNRISWGTHADGSASRIPPLGGSIVATYTPDNLGERVGYGVLIHVNHVFSFGFSRRDTGEGDETTYLLSADFMKLMLKPTPEAIARFRGISTGGGG